MNKLSVNWELAPEGTTHYMPENFDFYESWIKNNDFCFEVWCNDSGRWIADDDLYDYEHTFVEKPSKEDQKTVWDGYDLPPVGEVCEARHEEINNGLPVKAEILKHHANGKAAAFYWIDAPEGESNLLWAGRFFPTRTPEQMAEEERIAAIEEMVVLMKEARYSAFSTEVSPYEMAKVYAEKLYQAGYRKEKNNE